MIYKMFIAVLVGIYSFQMIASQASSVELAKIAAVQKRAAATASFTSTGAVSSSSSAVTPTYAIQEETNPVITDAMGFSINNLINQVKTLLIHKVDVKHPYDITAVNNDGSRLVTGRYIVDQQRYIFDTNVLIDDPQAIFKFEPDIVSIPNVVITQLKSLSKNKNDVVTAGKARTALNELKPLIKSARDPQGAKLKMGGILHILPPDSETFIKSGPDIESKRNEGAQILTVKQIINDPRILRSSSNNIVISWKVLEELDQLSKNENLPRFHKAREAISILEEYNEQGFFGNASGAILQILPPEKTITTADDKIIYAALSVKRDMGKVKLVTNDRMMRIKAHALGLKTEKYPTSRMQHGLMRLTLWNTITGKKIEQSEQKPFREPIVFSNQDNLLAVGMLDDINEPTVALLNAKTLKVLSIIPDLAKENLLIFSPDDSLLAIKNKNNGVSILRLDDKKTIKLLGHESAITAIAFDTDSSRVATGSRNGIINIWDAQNGNHIDTMNMGHTGDIIGIVFVQDCIMAKFNDGRILQQKLGSQKKKACAGGLNFDELYGNNFKIEKNDDKLELVVINPTKKAMLSVTQALKDTETNELVNYALKNDSGKAKKLNDAGRKTFKLIPSFLQSALIESGKIKAPKS